MVLRPKIAGECHAAVPYEFPEEKEKTSQDDKNIMRTLGDILCRLKDLEQLDNFCDLVCACLPCVPDDLPEIDPIPFDGVPFENIYADGLNYVGNIGSGAGQVQINYRVFDPVNGKEVAQLKKNDGDGAAWANSQGWGACWHRYFDRNEVWIAGTVQGTSTASLRVYDAAEMQSTRNPEQAILRQYDYVGFQWPASSSAALEVCPQTGHIYAGMASGPAPAITTVAVIDPETGEMITTLRAAETPGWDFEGQHVLNMVWHPGVNKMVASILRDELWTIDPITLEVSQLSGAIGGLIDTGHTVHEWAYGGDGKIYISPSKYSNVYQVEDPATYTPNNGTGGPSPGAWKTFTGQLGSASEGIPEGKVVVISRGDDGLLFSDPDNTGQVDVIDTVGGGTLFKFFPSFNPARTAYCYNSNTLSVVPWHNQDTEWYVQFFRFPSSFAVQIGGGGTAPPDQPNTPRPEDPPPPGEQDPGPGPGGDEEPGEGEDGQGDTDGDGIIIAHQCDEPAENGPVYGVTAKPDTIVFCDFIPPPLVTYEGEQCFYSGPVSGQGDPFTGQVEKVGIVSVDKSNVNGLIIRGTDACAGDRDLSNSDVAVYIMRAGDHPSTDPCFVCSGDQGGRFDLDGDLDGKIRLRGVNKELNVKSFTDRVGGPPDCNGGPTVEMDVYFRYQISSSGIWCGFGLFVSPWTVIKIRTDLPEDFEI